MRAPLAHLVVQPRGECRGALRSGAQASDAIVSVCWCPRPAQRLEEEALPSATSSARVEASRSPPAFLPRQSRQCSDQCQPPMLRTDLAGGACSAAAGARRHAPRPTRRAFATWSSEARVVLRAVLADFGDRNRQTDRETRDLIRGRVLAVAASVLRAVLADFWELGCFIGQLEARCVG